MDFGALPPEVNSGRMYAGAGPGPLMAAAAAWNGLAAELHSAAAGYGAVIADLSADWRGGTSESMVAAATPYVEWTRATAAQAEEASTQASAAVAAYEVAFAATVPPPVIAANRSLLLTLIATNILGQNTSAIAATEAHYAEMWAQDAAAMYGYSAGAAAATRLTPFATPPQTTNPNGTSLSAAAQAATNSTAGNVSQHLAPLMSSAPGAWQHLASAVTSSPLVTDVNSILGSYTTILGNGASPLSPLSQITNFGFSWLNSMNYVGLAQNVPAVSTMLRGGVPISGALGGIGIFSSLETPLAGPLGAAGATTVSSVSAASGQAGLAGSLSVPASWTSVAPVAKALAASSSLQAGSIAAPLLEVDGSTGMFSQMALSSLAGRAAGGAAVRTVAGSSARVLDKAPDTEALTAATILVIPVGEE